MIRNDNGWGLSKRSGCEPLDLNRGDDKSLEEQFLEDIRSESDVWKDSVRTAIQAARVGISADLSANRGCRVELKKPTQ